MTSPNSGQFKKGHDPRRHKFTTEERQRGFWNAIYSIVRRYPDAIGPDGRHMACHFLNSKDEFKAGARSAEDRIN